MKYRAYFNRKVYIVWTCIITILLLLQLLLSIQNINFIQSNNEENYTGLVTVYDNHNEKLSSYYGKIEIFYTDKEHNNIEVNVSLPKY